MKASQETQNQYRFFITINPDRLQWTCYRINLSEITCKKYMKLVYVLYIKQENKFLLFYIVPTG